MTTVTRQVLRMLG